MKKILTCVFAILMMAALTVTVFADPGSFVSSPSGISAPELVEYENSDKDCTAKIVICSYANRDSLSADRKAALEAAYNSIVNADDLSGLTSEIEKLAKKLQIETGVLAVSDLFDISYADCEAHEEHGTFTITLKPHMLDNFAGLLHYKNSQWVLVEHAEVSEDGVHLTFEEDELSPFAIVVHDGTAVLDEDGFPWWLLILVVVVVGGAVTFVVYDKKKKV
ncbi:MAG: hypothetical protein J6D21_12560 [Clostridia bacterium]|nr:hypothetical protein [Clostridia bacterium]